MLCHFQIFYNNQPSIKISLHHYQTYVAKIKACNLKIYFHTSGLDKIYAKFAPFRKKTYAVKSTGLKITLHYLKSPLAQQIPSYEK